ncbi:hypothetical protein COLO4_23353 [Corchorus olitorius]|uniref:RRM domain-containing protein n=1 Tax=Corchorus olitorius TaxID=93759 RepID=A0A1R3IH52_9ROSI|nr:hypothetical protein COLO4_23353 [Corchorus olitorius]
MSSRSRTLYVGNLPGDIREREVEDLFYKYGPIAHIDLKIPPRPPGYAFVEFEEARDAEDAIRGRDGYDFGGHRLRVELAHGGRGRSSLDRHSSHSGGRGRGPSRRSEYRVLVSGLPSSASWQDLKDHMRRAGDVCFSQVFRDNNGTTGIVDYTNYDDMKYAIKKLDDSEFRNAFSRSYVRLHVNLAILMQQVSKRKSFSQVTCKVKIKIWIYAANWGLDIRILWEYGSIACNSFGCRGIAIGELDFSEVNALDLQVTIIERWKHFTVNLSSRCSKALIGHAMWILVAQ